MSNDSHTVTEYVVNEREVVKQEILAKIRELQDNSYMSDLNGRIALQLIKTFIKYMDKE